MYLQIDIAIFTHLDKGLFCNLPLLLHSPCIVDHHQRELDHCNFFFLFSFLLHKFQNKLTMTSIVPSCHPLLKNNLQQFVTYMQVFCVEFKQYFNIQYIQLESTNLDMGQCYNLQSPYQLQHSFFHHQKVVDCHTFLLFSFHHLHRILSKGCQPIHSNSH